MNNTIMNTTKKIGDVGEFEIFQSQDISFIDSSEGNIVIGRFFTHLSKEGQSYLFNEHLEKLRNKKQRVLHNSVIIRKKLNVFKEMYTFLSNLVSTDENENNNLSIHDEMKLISSEYIELKKITV